LYFTASTNFGPGSHPLDMTSDEHRLTRSVYAMVLSADAPSPVVPESDEEKPTASPAEAKTGDTAPKSVRGDFAGLQQRTVALPIQAHDYIALTTGRAGQIYLLEDVSDPLNAPIQASTLTKFDLKTRKTERLAENVGSFDLSANGDKMLLQIVPPSGVNGDSNAQRQWVIVSALAPVKAGEGVLRVSNMEVKVDPLQEW